METKTKEKILASTEDKPVYYDKKNNRFSQIRKIDGDVAWCSYAEYYSDSRTSKSMAPYSFDYIDTNFVLVDKIGIDKIAEFNGVGWKVKK